MYVWVDSTELSGDILKAAQSTHLQKWLKKMQHAFGQNSRTVCAMFKLQEVAQRNPDVWEALMLLSKWDGYEEERSTDGGQTCVKETKPEGIWERPIGKKAERWKPGTRNETPPLF